MSKSKGMSVPLKIFLTAFVAGVMVIFLTSSAMNLKEAQADAALQQEVALTYARAYDEADAMIMELQLQSALQDDVISSLVLKIASLQVTEVVPLVTEEVAPTAEYPEGCPPSEFFDALTVGHLPGFGMGGKKTPVTVDTGCAKADIIFADGSYVTGTISADGYSLSPVAYVRDGKVYTVTQFNIRHTADLKIQGRAHKKGTGDNLGGLLTLLCVAEDNRAFTDACD